MCRWMSVPAVGTVNARGEGYRPFALKQLKAMKVTKRESRPVNW